eukprot:TRINITY_DN6610_c0_g1_i4.p1 TRINITY_DN6610_c0_g1~~TRINITY_DN6610_c0_g1_i4.p1  ORF type:complete len:995 (-),score=266.92 TRINITY_DN6610_c0_g1_i4:2318-5302(-)
MEAVVDRFRRMYPDVEQVKAQFGKYDADGDGNITAEEMQNGMTEFKDFTREQAKYAFDLADTNEDGKIDISEFVSLMFPSAKEAIANLRKAFKGPDDVAKKFKVWDSDGDGKISFEELKESAAKDSSKFLSEEDINAIFIVGDLNLDGEIDEEEFSKLMIPSISDIVAKFRYAHRSVEDVRKAFKTYDRDGDGAIDRGELHKALTNYKFNFSDQEVDIIFAAGDIDGDGCVDFEEFMYLMCPSTAQIVKKFRDSYKTINEVKGAFRKYDKNRDGGLSKSELGRMMMSTGHSFTDMEIAAILNLGDRDGDGEIDLDEFMILMTPSASETLSKIRQGITSIADVKGLFKDIDVDGDGLLSKEEMLNSPGCKFDMEQIEAIYELGDSNGDEVLDMGEFIAIMYPAAGEALAKLSKNYPNIDEVELLFRKLDFDNDGSITKTELSEGSIRFTPQEVEAIFALGDINDDGALDLEEFIGVMYPSAATVAGRLRGQYTDINSVKKAFAKIDLDGDGKVTKEEVAKTDLFNNQEIDALFLLGDSNNDGEIDLEEFIGVLYPVVAAALAKMTKDVQSVDDARYLFKQLDHDGDGLLSQEELRTSGCKFSAKEIEALFAVGDVNGDGEIDINEFINVMCPGATTVIARISAQFKCLEDIQEEFKKMDLDGDGQITREEMMEYSALNQQEVNAVFDLGDTDRDGSIDINEFIGVMQTSAPVPYTESGTIVTVGETEVYLVGSGAKCVIWCHDMKGFNSDDRTRQLVDKLAETTGWVIAMPNFLGGKKIEESADEYSWLSSITDWNTTRDFWVERLLPYLRDDLGIKAIGVLGTGWGSYVATRMSSYEEILACVNIQPLISSAVEAAKEDLYEVYEDVRCPTLMMACRNNCPNEKPGGLANNIYNSCSFGKKCEFVELQDMMHGFLLEGERSVEAIAVQSRMSMKKTAEFLGKFLHYHGEPEPVVEACCVEKGIDDFDLKTHSSDSCKTCLEIRHQANKAASRCM